MFDVLTFLLRLCWLVHIPPLSEEQGGPVSGANELKGSEEACDGKSESCNQGAKRTPGVESLEKTESQ
jgi:hypothetical protein